MIAIDGFEDALIGTGMRTTSLEVLVYDGYKAQELLNEFGYNDVDISEYLRLLGIDELGNKAPLFVFLDDEVRHELEQARAGRPRLYH